MTDGQFLVLYTGMVVMGAGLCWGTRALVLRAPTGLEGTPRPGDDELHPVDLASLVSGPEHAAVVAFLGLWQRGLLRPRDGTLPVPAGGLPMTRAELTELTVPWEIMDGASGQSAIHPVEEAVLDAVREAGDRPAATPPEIRQEEAIAELRSRLRRRLHPRIEVQQRLMARRLIVDPMTERRVYLAALWPLVVLGVGVTRLITHAGDNPVALAPLLLAAAVILVAALRVPRVTPLGRRVVARAGRPSRAVARRMAEQLTTDRPYGTDDPATESVGTDPVAAAAHGPALVWGAAPVPPAAFGFLPPRPGRRVSGGSSGSIPDAWIIGTTGGSLAGWGTLTGWSPSHGGDTSHSDAGSDC